MSERLCVCRIADSQPVQRYHRCHRRRFILVLYSKQIYLPSTRYNIVSYLVDSTTNIIMFMHVVRIINSSGFWKIEFTVARPATRASVVPIVLPISMTVPNGKPYVNITYYIHDRGRDRGPANQSSWTPPSNRSSNVFVCLYVNRKEWWPNNNNNDKNKTSVTTSILLWQLQ